MLSVQPQAHVCVRDDNTARIECQKMLHLHNSTPDNFQ